MDEEEGQPRSDAEESSRAKNVLGHPLARCCVKPRTGFYRNGFCETGPEDRGVHVVCAKMTEAFLTFSKSRGNDLVTPRPEWHFPGLRAGDRWCLCALRWREAHEVGVAPPVYLRATNEAALRLVPLEELAQNAADD